MPLQIFNHGSLDCDLWDLRTSRHGVYLDGISPHRRLFRLGFWLGSPLATGCEKGGAQTARSTKGAGSINSINFGTAHRALRLHAPFNSTRPIYINGLKQGLLRPSEALLRIDAYLDEPVIKWKKIIGKLSRLVSERDGTFAELFFSLAGRSVTACQRCRGQKVGRKA